MSIVNKTAEIECPECEYVFSAEEPVAGEVLPCLDCGLSLKVCDVVGTPDGARVVVELTESDPDDWGE